MGKLKVRVGDQWEEVTPTVPDEVIIATEDPYVTDPTTTTELWYDPDAVRPPSMAEEVYVGPDDPDVVAPLNTVDLWYDPDDPAVSAGGASKLEDLDDVDVFGASKADGEVLTWDEGAALWKSYPSANDRARVHAHHLYGRTTDPGTTWTVTLAAGSYLCEFQMSAVATATGVRYVNLQIGGVNCGQSKMYFNVTGQHHFMNTGVSEIVIPTDGDYTFTVTAEASTVLDQNDFGRIVLTPAMPGVVS